MVSDVNLSLKALQTDHIDIYWIHKDDPQQPVEEIVESFNRIMQSGKIGMIGCSNWYVDRIKKANEYAGRTGLKGFMLSQVQWSLAHTHEEYLKKHKAVVMSETQYAWYLKNWLPVFAYGAQAQGFFAKAARTGVEAVSPESRNIMKLKITKKGLRR